MTSKASALSLLITLACSVSAQAQECSPAPEAVVVEMLDMVNTARAQAGLGALSVNPELARAAQLHACDMADLGYFSHTSPSGSTLRTRVRAVGYRSCLSAENISYGWRSVAQVIGDLMASKGHRDNLLRSNVAEIGIGYRAPQGGNGPWWVQVFARPC
jgi:uncharacterized protein YkwD